MNPPDPPLSPAPAAPEPAGRPEPPAVKTAGKSAQVEAIFDAAMVLRKDEREAYVAQACAGDETLQAEVRLLLAAAAGAWSLMADTPFSPELQAEMARLKPEEVDDRIGRYKLREQIGEGAFGSVWLADQVEPVRRRVALKIIKLGMDTKDMIARFKREREALAMMDHPNIARVLDAGATEWGRPYIVMEYIAGANLDAHVRALSLGRKACVALMAKVAAAVQHAHQNGIIHRDLKPSNILVTKDGEPKVLDFGLAKALAGAGEDSLTLSYTGQLLGTPRYMAPEQVRGAGVDTRTDVYALGVILCELLTGEHPHDSRGSRDAFLHRIATEEPRRPRALRPDLDGELEMLLLKALSKSPDDRYRTAGEFADDLGRWLRDEPLIAGRPTFSYFARKWLRRHGAGVIGVGLIFPTLAVIAIVSSIRSNRVHLRNAEEVAQMRHVMELGERVRRNLVELENVRLLYFVLRDESLATEYKSARDAVEATFRQLHDLVAGTPDQEARVRRLAHPMDDFFALQGAEIEAQREAGPVPVVSLLDRGKTRELIDQIERLLIEFEKEQNNLLQARSEDGQRVGRENLIVIFTGTALTFIAAWGLRRWSSG